MNFFRNNRASGARRIGVNSNSKKSLESSDPIEVLGEIKKKIHFLEQRQELLRKQANTLKAATVTAGRKKDISAAKQKLSQKKMKDKEIDALGKMILQLYSQVSEISIASTANDTFIALQAAAKLMKKVQVDVEELEAVLENAEAMKEVNNEVHTVFQLFSNDEGDDDELLMMLESEDGNDATGSSEADLRRDYDSQNEVARVDPEDEIRKLINSIEEVRPPVNPVKHSSQDEVDREIEQLLA